MQPSSFRFWYYNDNNGNENDAIVFLKWSHNTQGTSGYSVIFQWWYKYHRQYLHNVYVPSSQWIFKCNLKILAMLFRPACALWHKNQYRKVTVGLQFIVFDNVDASISYYCFRRCRQLVEYFICVCVFNVEVYVEKWLRVFLFSRLHILITLHCIWWP